MKRYIYTIYAKSDNKSSKQYTQDIIRVRSSNVYGYSVYINDKNNSICNVYVQFQNDYGGPGDVYVYYDVPIRVYRKLISTNSKGRFVWKYLRNNYKYSKLTGDKRGKLPNAIN